MSRSKVVEAIKRHNKFLVIAHVGLEGDSLGSQFAFKILLEKLGKKAVVVNEGLAPSQYDFLDANKDIITDMKKHINYEAVTILDAPVIKRIGRAKKFLKNGKALINIDHHISNSRFGDINWVEPNASSCGEMVYRLYKDMRVPIDYTAALFIYTAILTDTGSFAYENTSSYTHRIAGELIKKGLEPHRIYQALYERRSLAEIGLLKEALSTIKLTDEGRVAYMYISAEMLAKFGLGAEATEGLINYARSVDEARVAVIFTEKLSAPGMIHISFRSKGDADVNKLASLFGGGGHKNASGCVVEGNLRAVIRKVIRKVKKSI